MHHFAAICAAQKKIAKEVIPGLMYEAKDFRIFDYQKDIQLFH